MDTEMQESATAMAACQASQPCQEGRSKAIMTYRIRRFHVYQKISDIAHLDIGQNSLTLRAAV
jgi:hypothetical protein